MSAIELGAELDIKSAQAETQPVVFLQSSVLGSDIGGQGMAQQDGCLIGGAGRSSKAFANEEEDSDRAAS